MSTRFNGFTSNRVLSTRFTKSKCPNRLDILYKLTTDR